MDQIIDNSDQLFPDTLLDTITGQDLRARASVIGCSPDIWIQIDGEIPGFIEVLLPLNPLDPEAPDEKIISGMTEQARSRLEYSDALDRDMQEVAASVLADIIYEHLPKEAKYRVDVGEYSFDGYISVVVGSMQGETLREWADAAGAAVCRELARPGILSDVGARISE